MDLFMPAERVLYNRSYYFSDEAVDDYNEYIADRDGVNIDVVSSLDFFMNEVWKEIDYAIDNDLSDEISCFDRMLRDLKCGGDPEHPTEISVVAKGTVERWDEPSRGLVVADSLLSLVQGTGSADALKDCQIDRLVDTNGETCDAKEITAALKRFESPSYIARGAIEDIESLPVGYYWCPDAVDPDPSYNGYLLNVFAGFDGRGLPGKFFELFGGVTLNDVPSFGFDDGWDGSCLNRLDWFEDAVGMDPDGLSAGLVANDIELDPADFRRGRDAVAI